MEDVKFVFKSFAITIVVIFLLQIRVGSNTIEASTHNWIQNSAITELMRGVADGGIKVSLDFYNWVRVKAGVGELTKTSFWSLRSSDGTLHSSSDGSPNPSKFRDHHARSTTANLERAAARNDSRDDSRQKSREESSDSGNSDDAN